MCRYRRGNEPGKPIQALTRRRGGADKIRRAIIKKPYDVKKGSENGCRPIWTYVNDDSQLRFYHSIDFFEEKNQYQPGRNLFFLLLPYCLQKRMHQPLACWSSPMTMQLLIFIR